jgi:peptidoglycan L-alanyl-D-glutamate endopeptidase CwlK
MYRLGTRSRQRLEGVDPSLVIVVAYAIQMADVDFTVLEGVRTPERQQMLYEQGATLTLNSKHLTGRAVDLGAYVGGAVAWDWPLYDLIAGAMKQAASDAGIAIQWGGDWRSFRDGPHFELKS